MLFSPGNATRSPDHLRVHATFELARTIVEFLAALCFIAGSIMFFFEAWLTRGTWLFLIGSIFFAMRPTIKLAREVKLMRMDDYEDMVK